MRGDLLPLTRRRRRQASLVIAALAMLFASVAMRQGEQPSQTFRITLGLRDREPSDWSGQIAVEGGEVTALLGLRFEENDTVVGRSRWKCRTRKYIANEKRYYLTSASGDEAPAELATWSNGVIVTLRGAAPGATLVLPGGKVSFQANEVMLGEPQLFLDGSVRIERLPDTRDFRSAAPRETDASQDDYPAFWVRYKTGKHYLAWVSYRKEKDRVLLAQRDGPEGAWSDPIEVAGPGDHFRVALASTHGESLWIVWASQRDRNWDLYGRPYREGKLGNEIRLTNAPGPDFWHRMTTDHSGRAWLVWQAFRDGHFNIYARCVDGDGWHEPIRVSDGLVNSWDPVVVADHVQDRIFVGWDSYSQDHYGVQIRTLSGGPRPQLGELQSPENSPLFAAHVSLACDRAGHLWAAWDESGQEWGKDTGYQYLKSAATRLYESRQIRVMCLADGKWREPAGDLELVLPADMKEYNELPQLQDDSDGRIWMSFRHRTCLRPREDGWAVQGRWDVHATAYLGDRWLPPIPLPNSAGRNDMRASSQRDRDGNVFFANASDNRLWITPLMMPRNHSIAVTKLRGAPRPSTARFREGTRPAPAPVQSVHPREKDQVARIRAHRVDASGKSYRILRGDLHRHTDVSADGIGDGSLMDLHRYALDAAAMDFVLVGDHNMGHDNEYCWWRTQKANDLYTLPATFISMYGYERSLPYPNGHRNIIWTERGHRTLPLPNAAIPAQMAADTGRLYAYLRRTNGIATRHTTATVQGTDWTEQDDALEPFVEIFQGFHASYEAPGAPRTPGDATARIHGAPKPEGFVSHALEKGYRIGFQSSSDHESTHVSYACVLAEEFSRQGIVSAMRKRHVYGATDNIVLDVRMNSRNIMGDEVQTSQPRLEVVVLGTGPIDRVEILRNGATVHTERPGENTEESRFRWEDPSPVQDREVSYYYVRVVQKDGHMAWASPIWVTR